MARAWNTFHTFAFLPSPGTNLDHFPVTFPQQANVRLFPKAILHYSPTDHGGLFIWSRKPVLPGERGQR